MHRFALIMLCLVAASTALHAADKRLTNADVLKMRKADLPESTIVVAIQNGSPAFDTSIDALIELKGAGVSPAVIEAMLKACAQPKAEEFDPPKAEEIENILRTMAQSESGGTLALVGFTKTNGQSSLDRGVHGYRMAFDALVRVSEDCIWKYIHLDSRLQFGVAKKQGHMGTMDEIVFNASNPGLHLTRATVIEVKGVGHLEKTENGWSPVRFEHNGIKPSTGGAIAAAEKKKNAAKMTDVPSVGRDDLVRLLEMSGVSPDAADLAFTSNDGKVTALSPAGFKVEKGNGEVVGRFVAPTGITPADVISVTCSTTPLFNRNPSLETLTKATVDGARVQHPGARITQPVRTKLAGVDAETFAMTIIEKGMVRQKVVTVAVCRKHVLGVVLHASPDSFAALWPAYRRVCESYTLTAK